jgi:hypothetical protein
MIGWLRRLASRPIGESERRRAFLAAALVLVAAAVALSLARERSPSHRVAGTGRPASTQPQAPPPATTTTPAPAAPSPPAPSSGIPTPDGGQLSGTAPAPVMAAARAFLSEYLRFSYGQAPPRFPDAAPPLAAQLARFHVDVGPALRSRHLVLLALRAEPRAGGFEVGALASDGTASFPIAAIVKQISGRWLAVRVVTAAAGP